MKKIVLFIFLGLISCKNSIKQQRNSGGVFGTTYSIIYDSNEDFQEVLRVKNSAIERIRAENERLQRELKSPERGMLSPRLQLSQMQHAELLAVQDELGKRSRECI